MNPVRLVISNQRGGVAKTTTVLALAHHQASRGRKVLIIDTDPQGSIAMILGLRTEQKSLYNLLIQQFSFEDCITKYNEQIDIILSDRNTTLAETILTGQTARELIFRHLLTKLDNVYDIVLIDVAPSITLLQTCAMMYAERILVPVTMDPLSLAGAMASIQTARTLNELFQANIQIVALLPVNVDVRLQMTRLIGSSLDNFAKAHSLPVLPAVRTDATVTKATRKKKILQDYDPLSRSAIDYTTAFDRLEPILGLPETAYVQQAAQE